MRTREERTMGKMWERALICLFLAAVVLAAGLAYGFERGREMEVRIPTTGAEDMRTFVKMRLTLIGRGEGFVRARVTEPELARLRLAGYDVEILVEDIDQELEWLRRLDEQPREGTDGYYRTYTEIVNILDSLATNYPDICALYEIGTSVLGRALYVMKISDNAAIDEQEPEILFDGAIHGDERIAVEVPLMMIEYLVSNYGVLPEITFLVNNREIWIDPIVNPDGVMASSRYNANGVDCNRDFGYMWDGWGGSPGPFSQPETQALRSILVANQFVHGTSYHSGDEFISYPWSYHPDPTMDDDQFDYLAAGYSSTTGYDYGQGFSGMYPINGPSKDTYYGVMGALGWTTELSYVKTPPQSQIDYYFELNREAMLYLMEQIGYGIYGTVTDSITGDPLPALVNVVEIDWPVYADPVEGDYHRFLLPGTYSVRVWANGYEPKTVGNIVVTANSATLVDVELAPLAEPQTYAYRVEYCDVTDPNDVYNNHTLTPWCLGPSDGKAVSIGVSGWIVLDMGEGNEIVNGPGDDFRVYEGGATPEGFDVYGANGWNGPWLHIGWGTATTDFDLAGSGLAQARYLKIVDDGGGDPNESFPGYDLESVEAAPPPAGPALAYHDSDIDDSVGGNGNGRLDPGETAEITITLLNVGAGDAEGISAELSTGDPYVTVLVATADYPDIPGGGGTGESYTPYVVEVDAGTPTAHSVTFVLDITAGGGYSSTDSFDLLVGREPVLIWEADHTPISGAAQQAALAEHGIASVITNDLFSQGEIDDFDAIFVNVGIYPNNHIISQGSQEALALESYVQQGGNLYIEGGDFWYYDPLYQGGHDFGPLFGISPTSDGSGDLYSVAGQANTLMPEVAGMSWSYSGENSYIDHISPISPAELILRNQSNSDPIGVARAQTSGGHTFGTSFEFGGLVDGQYTKTELMAAIIEFYGIGAPLPDVTIELVPDATSYSPGETLGYDFIVTNTTEEAQSFYGVADVTLPNGNPFPGNPVLGPIYVTLQPLQVIQGHRTHQIPLGAPTGTYTYRVRIGLPPNTVIDQDEFDFDVSLLP
jgi:hypothetical protein